MSSTLAVTSDDLSTRILAQFKADAATAWDGLPAQGKADVILATQVLGRMSIRKLQGAPDDEIKQKIAEAEAILANYAIVGTLRVNALLWKSAEKIVGLLFSAGLKAAGI